MTLPRLTLNTSRKYSQLPPARCSMPCTHAGQLPKSLPEHRSNCNQGPNRSNGVFQAPLLAWASHQLLPTDPSGPTQNTSRGLGVRATAVTAPWADPAGAISNGVFQAPLLAWASHQLLPT